MHISKWILIYVLVCLDGEIHETGWLSCVGTVTNKTLRGFKGDAGFDIQVS